MEKIKIPFDSTFQSFFNASMDSIFVIDTQGYFRDVNPSYCNLVGYTKEELLTMSIPDIEAIETQEEIKNIIEEAIPAGRVRFEKNHRHKNGKIIKVEISSTFFESEEEKLFLVFARDLTVFEELKRNYDTLEFAGKVFDVYVKELRRNYDTSAVINSLLRLSLEHIAIEEILKTALKLILSIKWLAFESSGSIFLVETDGKSEFLVMKAQNGLLEEIRGKCSRVPFEKCLCGMAAKEQKIYFSSRVDELHEICYENMPPHGHYCIPVISDGKTLGIINIYLREGHSRNQKEEDFLTAIANVLAGIILRKNAEKEKEHLHSQLLQIQKLDAIGIMAGGIAHDFNNILTAIMGYSQVGLKKSSDREEISGMFHGIERCARRASDLTRQLLLFSRKEMMNFTHVNISKTVGSLIKMLDRLIGEDIFIITDLEPDVLSIMADSGNLEQVVMNLVINAKDAMPEGGTVTVKTENVILGKDVSAIMAEAKAGKFVLLSVSDTGSGMDEKILEHIFEPFFTTKLPGKGTGLGLSVVYGIVKEHNGWIDVSSKTGQGTIFNIYFPALSVEHESEINKRIILENAHGNGERILLLEDDEEVRNFSVNVLTEHGYVVFEAENVKTAMNIFAREKGEFKLIFSDVVLPDKNVIQFMDHLLCCKPDLLFLLTSGYTDQKSQWSLIKERKIPFLRKPYIVSELLGAIRNVIKS